MVRSRRLSPSRIFYAALSERERERECKCVRVCEREAGQVRERERRRGCLGELERGVEAVEPFQELFGRSLREREGKCACA